MDGEDGKAGDDIMEQKGKLTAAAMAGVVLVTFFISIGIFALYLNHECIGEGCSKCAQICMAEEAVEHIILACGSVVCLFLPICYLTLKTGRYCNPCIRCNTLIRFKVKLSN